MVIDRLNAVEDTKGYWTLGKNHEKFDLIQEKLFLRDSRLGINS